MTSKSNFVRIRVVPSGTRVLPETDRRLPPSTGDNTSLPPVLCGKGVVNVNVVTYEALFQLLMVLVAFAELIVIITAKKK